jgi:drug/metabolite transporter (DMT)-like permease
VAGALALLSAACFALAAALQQRGQFQLAEEGTPVTGAGSLLRLLAVPVWLLGTLVLLFGYGTQGAALDRGRLVVIQPLLVMTIVFALPFGHWLTGQHVVRRQVWGAAAVVIGLSLFVAVGDPDDGVDTPSSSGAYLLAIAAVSALAVLAIVLGRRAAPSRRAAALGAAAGIWFGLSATFTKETLEQLHHGVAYTLEHPEVYGLLGFGAIAFVVQQLSLATGQLAPAMAAVSVLNPLVSVLLGVLLFDERLTRPWWHVLVAALALLGALYGAVQITLSNRERTLPGSEAGDALRDKVEA